ncbi:tRNA pseudouridine(13) synthase TruD [Allochromatium vinosum]|uniref:tRNA pseudouridine synthase D n=1 Tax=Allochromatium vinosum (strain ATCC 17899 / DSM 180 / NBRC 103801 / NCIMB 10441 / D) TaxID=572477 RepID=D3RN70_ALLVD|nr:tRNA pseudouridine(13) synthase TruD [Allochromatium vinosum]ADC61354.1 tRNA pseudouridine synthase D TruD [Allochromatium vinosum DSM 180]MBK1654703.1 tRNA pseudouridine(13) synthase TruD [Allochromatium vinosum]
MSDSTLPRWTTFNDLPRAHGEPLGSGQLRVEPEDFQVTEVLGFEPDGEGDHCLLWVRKTGANTEWVARRLAATAGVPLSTVGYAGLKDRWAVTEQWFSLPRPRAGEPEPDWGPLAEQGIEVLEVHPHRRKLKRGSLSGNRFRIRLRDCRLDPAALDARLESIRARGVPNYFGEQRFGHDDGNLHRAHALLTGAARRVPRHQRGLWLSAARSQIFNELLAERVRRGDWDRLQPGDCPQLAGRHSFFLAETLDETLHERVARFDLHPTGPLWGRGELPSRLDVQGLEHTVAAGLDPWPERLAGQGLEQERRSLRLMVADLTADLADGCLRLEFGLSSGAYATSVLREIVDTFEQLQRRDGSDG